MDFERRLPEAWKLDNYLKLDGKIFDDELAYLKDRQVGGNVLNIHVEFASFETVMYFDCLAQALVGSFIDDWSMDEYSSETQEAVYRALMFALQTAESVHRQGFGLDAGGYLEGLIKDSPDPKEQFEQDIHTYLSNNPHINDLIIRMDDELDEGRGQQPAIELAAGLGFMLIERHIAKTQFSVEHARTPTGSLPADHDS